MSDDKSVPDEKGQTEASQADPSSSGDGKSAEEKSAEAPSKIPENLEGKSTTELVKMYGELERKLGEQSASVSEAKKIKENLDVLSAAIYSDPNLVKQVEGAVQHHLYGDRKVDDKPQDEGKKGDEEAATPVKPSEERKHLENRIISEFAEGFGLNKLSADERKAEFEKVGNKLADMIDPSGSKSMNQVLSGISLDKLPQMLEDAYWLSHKDALIDKGSQDQDFASIRSTPSSSVKSDGDLVTLTERERAVAEKLGVKPENYLKQKQQIQEN